MVIYGALLILVLPLFCCFKQNDVVHVHVNAVEPLPSCLRHRYVVRILRDNAFHPGYGL